MVFVAERTLEAAGARQSQARPGRRSGGSLLRHGSPWGRGRHRRDLARSYYLGVEGEKPCAVCLAPGSAVAGQDFEIHDIEFQLTLAKPVEFPLYYSSTRLVDPPGAMVDVDLEQLTPLPPIRTVLHAGRKRQPQQASVRLHAHLSEVGVLELSCREVDSNRDWRLQFDIRSTTQTDRAAYQSDSEEEGFLDEKTLIACREQIEAVFGESGKEKPATLIKELGTIVGTRKASNGQPPFSGDYGKC